MKSAVQPLFDEWLTLMEKAFNQLSTEEFRQLEDKIKHEITFHREPKKGGVDGLPERPEH